MIHTEALELLIQCLGFQAHVNERCPCWVHIAIGACRAILHRCCAHFIMLHIMAGGARNKTSVEHGHYLFTVAWTSSHPFMGGFLIHGGMYFFSSPKSEKNRPRFLWLFFALASQSRILDIYSTHASRGFIYSDSLSKLKTTCPQRNLQKQQKTAQDARLYLIF